VYTSESGGTVSVHTVFFGGWHNPIRKQQIGRLRCVGCVGDFRLLSVAGNCVVAGKKTVTM
jgi:hypothetical protein